MPKNDNVCPMCHQPALKPFDEVGHGWLKCAKCGYTHLPNPTRLGQSQIVDDPENSTKDRKEHRVRRKPLPKVKAGSKS